MRCLGKLASADGEGCCTPGQIDDNSRAMVRPVCFAVLLAVCAAAEVGATLPEPHAAAPEIGQDLIGTRVPEWTLTDWQNSPPLSLKGLSGKVVLVRWWTAPSCPYCATSADALSHFAETYRDQGLVVIGAYHHKTTSTLTPEHVAAQAQRLGFQFPVAIDRDWQTLHRWWLDRTKRGWTSVTFLIGRDGTVRHIHGGGAYYDGEAGYAALEGAIQKALAAPIPAL